MKNLLVVVVVLTVFFSLFIYVGTHTPLLKNTPFYWVAKDLGDLFFSVGGDIGKSVMGAAYPALAKLHILKK